MQLKNILSCLLCLALLFSCGDHQSKDSNQTNSSSLSHSNSSSDKNKLFKLLSASETGIDFENVLVDDPLNPDKNVMDWPHYYNGGGVAIGDLNNDGLQDLVFSGNEVDNKVYLNKGDLKFEDVTAKANINQNRNWVTGVSLADVNQDGWLDIYFCQASQFNKGPETRRNLLFINNRDMTFTEAAQKFGLDDGNHSVQAVFFDMDKDGDLDCFVHNSSRYVQVELGIVFDHLKDKNNLVEASSNLYRNDRGKFKRVTEEAGILRYGFSLGNFLTDINNDGYLDIYQANDYSVPDFMYINQKDGTFRDEIKRRTKQLSWFAMGADCADINNDGHLDIAVVDMAATDHIRGKTLMAPMDPELFYLAVDTLKYQRQHMFNTLQLNNGNGTYSNIAGLTGMQNTEWSWASLFADFDNDSFKDYFVATGFRRYVRDNDSRIRMQNARDKNKSIPVSLRKELYDAIPQVPLENFIFQNDGNLHFEEKGKEWGLDLKTYSNGAAYGDLDQDGDLDLVINNIDGAAHFYENTTDGSKNYLRVNLESKTPKEGTKVVLQYQGKTQVQEYSPVRGYVSVVEPTLHFGLGLEKQIERLSVYWPNGKCQEVQNPSVNQVLNINIEDARLSKRYNPQEQKEYFSAAKKTYFTHIENEYNDFEKEVLLPYKQSTLGPHISGHDINQDGLEDFYVGGAAGQTGAIFYQNADGSFKFDYRDFLTNKPKEELGSCFFDADGDGDKDLYVVCGGNAFKDQPEMLQDKLYFNQGGGRFKDMSSNLPKIEDAGLKVKANDFDGDGDLDLFVGGRLKSGLYPNAPRSYILENEKGVFKDVTADWSEELLKPGMINDFIWTDFNGDGKSDLILSGEWMPISFYQNTGTAFENVTGQKIKENLSGWWFSLKEVDIDNDGDKDLIAGNLGLNSKFHASNKKPFEVMANDFDGNGTCDIVLTKDYKGKKVPVRGRQCSSEQMPFIEDKFETYEKFANASISEILGNSKIEQALKLSVNCFESVLLINENGKYVKKELPRIAQAFPIYGIENLDLNNDGLQDLILVGNLFGMEIETPRLDAGNGLTLINKGGGEFEPVGINSGLNAPFDAKDLIVLNGKQTKVLVANNNGPLQVFNVLP